MSSVLKNLPLTSGVFIVVFFLSAVSAQKNLDLSRQHDFESMEEIQDLLQKVQLVLDMKMVNKVRQWAEPEDENDVAADPNLDCKCDGLQCSCCLLVKILRFSKNCCLKLTYVPANAVVQVNLMLGTWKLFSRDIPANQPPPTCAKVTQISRRASVCIVYRDFQVLDKSFKGCATLKAKAFGRTLLTRDLGCFQMQVPDAKQHVGEVELPYLELGEASVKDPEPIYDW